MVDPGVWVDELSGDAVDFGTRTEVALVPVEACAVWVRAAWAEVGEVAAWLARLTDIALKGSE